jgi:transposase InsO family protein
MGSTGDCYDNAASEAFHASLKKVRIYRRSWPTRAEARAAIFEYIEGFYNPRRRHSTLGYLSQPNTNDTTQNTPRPPSTTPNRSPDRSPQSRRGR